MADSIERKKVVFLDLEIYPKQFLAVLAEIVALRLSVPLLDFDLCQQFIVDLGQLLIFHLHHLLLLKQLLVLLRKFILLLLIGEQIGLANLGQPELLQILLPLLLGPTQPSITLLFGPLLALAPPTFIGAFPGWVGSVSFSVDAPVETHLNIIVVDIAVDGILLLLLLNSFGLPLSGLWGLLQSRFVFQLFSTLIWFSVTVLSLILLFDIKIYPLVLPRYYMNFRLLDLSFNELIDLFEVLFSVFIFFIAKNLRFLQRFNFIFIIYIRFDVLLASLQLFLFSIQYVILYFLHFFLFCNWLNAFSLSAFDVDGFQVSN